MLVSASKSKEDKFYLIWFPSEFMYTVVEGKSVEETNPRVKDKVHVKDVNGTWEGIVYTLGTERYCKEKQQTLEELCETINEEHGHTEENTVTTKRKGAASEKEEKKRRKKVQVLTDSESELSDEEDKKQDCEIEFDLVRKEKERVNSLLQSSKSKVKPITEDDFGEKIGVLFQGMYSRLDGIAELLKTFIEEQRETTQGPSACSTPIQPKLNKKLSSSQSPTSQDKPQVLSADDSAIVDDPEFIVGGINLIADIPAKVKKPTLYATALMSQLFTDDEMREGSVEPKENKGKKALEQSKINLIKKCIRVKYGEKILERSWSEIRTSMNQKCLDKLKQYRRVNPV